MPGQGEEGVAKVTLTAYFGILVGVSKGCATVGWRNRWLGPTSGQADGQCRNLLGHCFSAVTGGRPVEAY